MTEMTVKEAAEALGMKVRNIHHLVEAGKLKSRRRVVPGRSALSPLVMIESDSLYALREDREKNGEEAAKERSAKAVATRWAVTPEKRAEMAKEGYMTATEAGKEIGVTAYYITRSVKTGKMSGKVDGIVWMHKDAVRHLKRERERKMELMLR